MGKDVQQNGGQSGLTYVDGRWCEEDPKILGARSHAVWLASVAFDGARALAGAAPDLGAHCARVVYSAQLLGLAPGLSGVEIERIAWDGIRRFAPDAELYICPMFYAESGFVTPEPDSTRFVMTMSESPLPAGDGFSACLSSYRRPAKDMAPTEAKASCLYPNVARAVAEANARGFDMGIICDPNGNVAEFAYKNLFLVQDGAVHTPAPNGTFLNGITRQRVIALLRGDGIEVIERAIDPENLDHADEVFATGNYAKIQPCTRIGARTLEIGPVTRRARELYFAYARGCTDPGT